MTVHSRRAFIGGAAGAYVALTCSKAVFAATTDPDQPGLEFVYEAIVTLEPTVEVGRTPIGTRRRIAITGGSFAGPSIRGKVLSGGADWQLQRADDWTVIEADYMMQADDGTLIHVRNVGLTNSRVANAKQKYLRSIPSFEVPAGPHEWLNQAVFVGTLGPPPENAPKPSVCIRIYRVI